MYAITTSLNNVVASYEEFATESIALRKATAMITAPNGFDRLTVTNTSTGEITVDKRR